MQGEGAATELQGENCRVNSLDLATDCQERHRKVQGGQVSGRVGQVGHSDLGIPQTPLSKAGPVDAEHAILVHCSNESPTMPSCQSRDGSCNTEHSSQDQFLSCNSITAFTCFGSGARPILKTIQ